MSSQGEFSGDTGEVEPWEPRRAIRSIDIREARLANGFMRCHAERWFPGFAERWTPLISVLGCDLQVLEIKPILLLPDYSWRCYRGAIEGEAVLIGVEETTANLIAEEVVPNISTGINGELVVDYLMQRFMAVLGMTQTISETAGGLMFYGRCEFGDIPVVAAVRLSLSINTNPCSVLVALGQELVDRMDRLWRRQVHSSGRVSTEGSALRFEIAQLGVPPSVLSDYVNKGTIIDLELPASDSLILRVGSKVFMPAKMVDIDGMLGCQTVQGTAPVLGIPDGTSRLSVEIASVDVDSNLLSELAQVGAVLNTGRPISNRVVLSINQDRVAEARLSIYQGRYAVEVL